MEALECIKTRRSIRKYKEQAVTEQDILNIIENAAYAPSWKNTQTSRYIAVLDSELKNRLATECMMNFEFNENTAKNAPAIVVLTTINERSGYERDGSFSTSKGTHWQSFDAGIAAQTFCLSAHALGMATVIMGIFDECKVAELLQIPDNQSVSAVIVLGYADEEPQAPKRKEVAELVVCR